MLLAAPLIDLPAAYRLLSAMPSGINSMVVAHAYGLDMEIAAEAVTWSTAIVVAAPSPRCCCDRRNCVSPPYPGPVLQHVTLEVAPADVGRSVEFWTLLGFVEVEPPPELATTFTWLEREGTQIHLDRQRVADRAAARPRRGRRRRLRATLSSVCGKHGFEVTPGREHWGAPRA